MCINGTGILNAWMKKALGATSYEEMNQYAQEVPVGSDGLTVLPFGNGAERILGTKDIGAHIKGLQFNTHTKGHLYRASQEGIACSFAYGGQIMEKIGLRLDTIKAGRANLFLSPLFIQTLANLTGATVELYETDGAIGAARGAGIGAELYDDTNAFDGLKLLSEFVPEKNRDPYLSLYQRWSDSLAKELNNNT